MNKLTVVIPSRTWTNLHPCLLALIRKQACDIVVVWDRSHSNHWTPHFEQFSEFKRVSVKAFDDDFVFARNCNRGIMAADPTSDIVLLNDDALLVTCNGLTTMQQHIEARPDIGIVGAVTDVTGQPLQQPHYMGLREVPFFAFICVLIPRRTISAVGLLDERYCLDYGVEDNDYCEAVKRAGLRCAVDDNCFVNHSSLRSTYRGDPRAYRSFAQNQKLFCEKWGLTA